MSKSTLFYRSIFFFLMVFGALSCKEDDAGPKITNKENAAVNQWIKENMDFWYYWNTTIPDNVDVNKNPDEYFEALLNDEDRFSWIQDNYEELINSLNGINKEAGYEFVLYREAPGSNNVIAQVLYIKPGSPASATALKRGDVISKINNTGITVDNYRTLLGQISEDHSITYRPLLSVEDRTFGSESTLSLTTTEFAENPNFLSKVITVNERKVGYYVYNFFAPGNNKAYDNEMENIFSNFKAQGITDLVLDLRYNSGGAESSAQNLASHIGKGITSSSIFARREYNDLVEEEILKTPDLGPSFLTTKFLVKSANVGNQLTGSKVYILTGSRTASASELIINGLRPYMEVFLIGDTTVGKNVGSISLFEEDNPQNKWGMQPIVVKILNTDNQSDYSNGFFPNVVNLDNSLYIYPLGDERENLLRAALDQIAGIGGRIGRDRQPEQEILGHSLDIKKRSNQLFIDERVPRMDLQ